MAGFFFNFSLGDAAAGGDSAPAVDTPASASPQPMRAGERFLWAAPSSPDRPDAFSAVEIPPLRFEIVNTADAGFLTKTGAISSILTTSDVQTGVYEGGFKLWECAVDLVGYMRESSSPMPAKVMELGCGHGLPGIYALQQGATIIRY